MLIDTQKRIGQSFARGTPTMMLEPAEIVRRLQLIRSQDRSLRYGRHVIGISTVATRAECNRSSLHIIASGSRSIGLNLQRKLSTALQDIQSLRNEADQNVPARSPPLPRPGADFGPFRPYRRADFATDGLCFRVD